MQIILRFFLCILKKLRTFAADLKQKSIMKKVLFIALSALMLMACDHRNAPDIPKEDQSVLNKASKNVISVLGTDKATAEQKFIKAGFRKIEGDIDGFFESPKHRVVSIAKQRTDDDDVSCFVYNISEELEDASDEDKVNAIIESKQTAVIFMASYMNGILANINGKLIVGAEVDNVNGLYLDCSENLHGNISGLAATWEGSITDKENDDEVTEYESYKKYSNALYPMNSLFAEETGAGQIGGIFSTKAFAYHITWDKPDESEARWQINNAGYKTAIAEAGFSISYSDPDMY